MTGRRFRDVAAIGVCLLAFTAAITAALAQPSPSPTPPAPTSPAPTPPAPTPPAPTPPAPTQPDVEARPALVLASDTAAHPAAATAVAVATPLDDPRHLFVPVLNISGAEKGEGKISAGLDVLLRDTHAPFDMQVGLKLDVASADGLASVVTGTFDAGGLRSGGTWQGGADLTFTPMMDLPTLDKDLQVADRMKLLLGCLRDDFEATVRRIPKRDDEAAPREATTTERVKLLAEVLDYDYYCDVGKKEYLALLRKTLPVPRYQYSLGFRVGASVMTYLEPVAGTSMSKLVEDSHKRVWQVGGRAVRYFPASRRTVEVSARAEQSQRAATDKARWCVNDSAVDGAPAQICKEHPNRAPTETVAGVIGVYGGVVAPDRTWRASLGLTGGYTHQAGTNPWQIGVEMPLFLTRATPEYAGLVRVTPSIALVRNAKREYETKVLLTVALLGKRTLFQTALE